MGKAVPKGIKSKSLLLMKEFPDMFNADFEHNKKAIAELSIPLSKTNRNLVVGFASRKIRQHDIKEKLKAEAAKRLKEKEEAAKEVKVEAKPEIKPEAKAETKAEANAEAKAEGK